MNFFGVRTTLGTISPVTIPKKNVLRGAVVSGVFA